MASQNGQFVPTNIEATMHTMFLNPPDPSWYKDIEATSHMTYSNGNFSSYNLNNHHGITVGSGHTILIHGYGHTCFPSRNHPLSFINVLHVRPLEIN